MARGHGVNMQLPLCSVQVACDGAVIKQGASACHRCREKLAKKNKAPPALKGAKTCVSGAERREMGKLKDEQ